MKMKKFLVLLMFIGAVASLAQATTTIQPMISSLNGAPITPVSVITVYPSDTINFDIYLVTDEGAKLLTLDTVLSVAGPGDLSWDSVTWVYNEGMNLLTQITPLKSVNVDTASFGAGMSAGILVDHFLMHCTGLGDVTISVVNSAMQGGTFWFSGAPYTGGWGNAIVHQIPEPATIALLCLGGLLLRKK